MEFVVYAGQFHLKILRVEGVWFSDSSITAYPPWRHQLMVGKDVFYHLNLTIYQAKSARTESLCRCSNYVHNNTRTITNDTCTHNMPESITIRLLKY